MVRVKLFAHLAEAAGTREVEVDGRTVADVLQALEARYGPSVGRHLAHCTVWVDGDKASADTAVGEGNEVAVLPPVSGGQR